MSNIINVGDRVDLRILKQNKVSTEKEREYRAYKSQIVDIIDENIIKLVMPIEGGNIVLLPLQGIFDIFFYTNSGLYQSKGTVIERLKENNLFVFLFELTQPIKKNQRREFYRFNCIIDMKYAKVTDLESKMILPEVIEESRGSEIKWNEAFIVDISGGGIRFTSEDDFTKGSFIVANFNLMINHRMKQFSTIIKVVATEKILNRSGQYESRGKYISLRKDETEEIVRYIFEEERKSRKNRKS